MWSALVQLLTSLVLGIYSGSLFSFENLLIFIFVLFFIVLFSVIIFKKFAFFRLLLVFSFCVGFFSYHYHADDVFRSAYPLKDKYITVIGKICDLPEHKEDFNTYKANVQRIYYLGKLYKVNENIHLTSSQMLNFGDSIIAEGFLKGFDEPLNKGDFNNKLYNFSRNVYFKMHSENINMCKNNLLYISPGYFFTAVKSRISDIINEKHSGDKAALFHAILLNRKNYFSEEAKELLTESNAMHLFYPCFLHISILLSLSALFKSLIGQRKRNIILIILLFLYALFNTESLYIIKTAVILAISIYLKDRYGFCDYFDIFSLVCIILLIFNPLTAFNSGFLFSSVCNIVLFRLYPVLSEKIPSDNFSRRQFISIWLSLLLSILPLQAYFFYKITPFAYLLTTIYMPLVSTLFFTSLSGTVLNFSFIRYTSSGLTIMLFLIPKHAMKLPFYNIPVPQPSITIIAAYYLLLATFYLYRSKRRFSSVLTSSIAGGLIFINIFQFCTEINKLKIEFVNVSHGDGTVLSIPFKETVIIDGGGTTAFSDYNYGKEIFVPYLKRNGHYHIDLAVVSHYHEDHCKGTLAAMQKLKVCEVLLPDCTPENNLRKEIEEIANEKNIRLSFYKAGDKLKFKSGMTINILSAGYAEANNENDTSFVLSVKYGNFSALFTGDMTAELECRLLDKLNKHLLLKVPHHGSLTSSSQEFLNKISPECAVISVNENSGHSLPSPEIVKRYKASGAEIFRTDIHGNITFRADKGGKYSATVFKNEISKNN